jgi:hypothetical protein
MKKERKPKTPPGIILVSPDEIPACYGDMGAIATMFSHAIIKDEQGVLRWKANRLMCMIQDDG